MSEILETLMIVDIFRDYLQSNHQWPIMFDIDIYTETELNSWDLKRNNSQVQDLGQFTSHIPLGVY